MSAQTERQEGSEKPDPGVFLYVKKYKGFTGRNPKTGKSVEVKSKKLPFFKCGKKLKELVDYQEV